MRSAEEYTISVRKEFFDTEFMYVARVDELPDVEEYSESYDAARALALDTIVTTQQIYLNKGLEFPEPKKFSQENYSGRMTLRLMPRVHAQAIKFAEEENVSLNFFVSSCVTAYVSGKESSSKILHEKISKMEANIKQILFDSAMNRSLFSQVSSGRHMVYQSTVKTNLAEEAQSHKPAFKSGNWRSSIASFQ